MHDLLAMLPMTIVVYDLAVLDGIMLNVGVFV